MNPKLTNAASYIVWLSSYGTLSTNKFFFFSLHSNLFSFERSTNLNSILMYHALFLKNTRHSFFGVVIKQNKQNKAEPKLKQTYL